MITALTIPYLCQSAPECPLFHSTGSHRCHNKPCLGHPHQLCAHSCRSGQHQEPAHLHAQLCPHGHEGLELARYDPATHYDRPAGVGLSSKCGFRSPARRCVEALAVFGMCMCMRCVHLGALVSLARMPQNVALQGTVYHAVPRTAGSGKIRVNVGI